MAVKINHDSFPENLLNVLKVDPKSKMSSTKQEGVHGHDARMRCNYNDLTWKNPGAAAVFLPATSISSPPGGGSMKPPDTALIRSPSIRMLCSDLGCMSGSSANPTPGYRRADPWPFSPHSPGRTGRNLRPGPQQTTSFAYSCCVTLTVWRRVSHRALQCGQHACAAQSPRRHGSGEHRCMRR